MSELASRVYSNFISKISNHNILELVGLFEKGIVLIKDSAVFDIKSSIALETLRLRVYDPDLCLKELGYTIDRMDTALKYAVTIAKKKYEVRESEARDERDGQKEDEKEEKLVEGLVQVVDQPTGQRVDAQPPQVLSPSTIQRVGRRTRRRAGRRTRQRIDAHPPQVRSPSTERRIDAHPPQVHSPSTGQSVDIQPPLVRRSPSAIQRSRELYEQAIRDIDRLLL